MTRTEAARTNGPLSNGPVTDEGKARSSRNAQTHGLCSEIVVMEGESKEAFDALAAAIFASHVPVTIEEADLVFEIAANRWRLRRCMEMEKALFEEQMDRLRTDKENPVTDAQVLRRKALALVAESSAMKQLHRHNSRLRRAAEKAEQEFRTLKRERIELEVALQMEEARRERAAKEAGFRAQAEPKDAANEAAPVSEPSQTRYNPQTPTAVPQPATARPGQWVKRAA
jgi:hypothetical protein